MFEDVTAINGFPLLFDTENMDVLTGSSYHFERKLRKLAELESVLYQPAEADPQQPGYYLFYPQALPESAQKVLDSMSLTYSLVMMPSLHVGEEFVKTSGHYHPFLEGTKLGYPEVYTQLAGKLLLFLQQRDPEHDNAIVDCRLITMTPGVTVVIPPNYAHVLINPTGSPSLMAGLYGHVFKPDYSMVTERRGLAYYILKDNGSFRAEENPLYPEHPPLKQMDDTAGTQFEYFDPGVPVWTSFLASPDRYAFLSDGAAAKKQFQL